MFSIKRTLVIVLVFIAALWTHRSAYALSVPSVTTSCSSFSASGSSASAYVVIGVIGPSGAFPGAILPVSNGAFSGSITFPAQPAGTYLNYFVYESSVQGYITGATFVNHGNCSTSSPGTPFFNPGDGRVDPRPGDRMAVYCRSAGIAVWGVSDHGQGFYLTTFTTAQIATAKQTPLSVTVTAGQVSLGLDSTGNFWIAWQGGLYQATGRGDFAKSGSCPG